MRKRFRLSDDHPIMEEWCYEDSIGEDGDEECPTGGWLTGHPLFVTCKVCIERFKLKEYRDERRGE